jgi:hypothetical protein
VIFLLEYDKIYAKLSLMNEDKSYRNYLYLKESSNKEKKSSDVGFGKKKKTQKKSEIHLLIASRLYVKL